jgi:ATP-dependent exoDNAse (exonuclease V) alpha subunit
MAAAPAEEPPRLPPTPQYHDYRAAAQEQLQETIANLNDQQKAAVNASVRQPSSILVGAGTGKTTTVIARIRNMIANGIPPRADRTRLVHDILCRVCSAMLDSLSALHALATGM